MLKWLGPRDEAPLYLRQEGLTSLCAGEVLLRRVMVLWCVCPVLCGEVRVYE